MPKTLPISKFVQNYRPVLTEAERTDEIVVLVQRGGRPAWVLETEDRVRETQEATDFLSGALFAIAHDEVLVKRFSNELVGQFPWAKFLPDSDWGEFVHETSETLRACASIGKFTAFVTLINDWRNTAEIWSDSKLAQQLTTEIDVPLNLPVE